MPKESKERRIVYRATIISFPLPDRLPACVSVKMPRTVNLLTRATVIGNMLAFVATPSDDCPDGWADRKLAILEPSDYAGPPLSNLPSVFQRPVLIEGKTYHVWLEATPSIR